MTIPVFAYIAALSFFLPSLIGIFRLKRYDKTMKLLIIYCSFSAGHVVVEYVFGRMGRPTQALSNFHELVEIVCLTYIYYLSVRGTLLKDIIHYSALVFVLVWILHKFYFEDPAKISEIIQTTGRFLLICLSIVVLYTAVRDSRNHIAEDAIFWITGGTLLYSTGSIIVVTMGNTLLQANIEYFNYLWYFNWSSTIIANLFYSRSLFCKIH